VTTRPDQFVGVATYTSGDGSAVSVDSYNFAPELIFIKDRDASNNWSVFDTVRGYANRLSTDGAGKEQDWSDYFGSFDPNGFTVKAATSDLNRDTNKICSWGWKSGGNPGISTTAFWKDDQEYASAAAAGMNGGSITPIGASVGTKQGFSIITYRANLTTGATISHGLTQKPDFAIFKNRDSTLGENEVDWGVYHSSIGATHRLELNQTLAAAAFPGPFNNTEPTSSIFTFGGGSQGHSYLTNGPSGDRFVGYIWHNVPGLQKFGSYVADSLALPGGPFVECGFRPSLVIIKNADRSGEEWCIYDNKRNQFNPTDLNLFPNNSNQEYQGTGQSPTTNNRNIDLLSNGFKINGKGNPINHTAGDTHIFAAWAEAPTINLYGGQSNAR